MEIWFIGMSLTSVASKKNKRQYKDDSFLYFEDHEESYLEDIN